MFLFGCTVKYDKTQDDGLVKTVSEKYLVKGVSILDASQTIVEELTPFVSGELEIESIKKVNVSDVVQSNYPVDDKWYMVKIGSIVLDEKTGQEKVTMLRSLFQAADLQSAINKHNKFMKQSMMDWYYVSVTETRYLDYFTPAES